MVLNPWTRRLVLVPKLFVFASILNWVWLVFIGSSAHWVSILVAFVLIFIDLKGSALPADPKISNKIKCILAKTCHFGRFGLFSWTLTIFQDFQHKLDYHLSSFFEKAQTLNPTTLQTIFLKPWPDGMRVSDPRPLALSQEAVRAERGL